MYRASGLRYAGRKKDTLAVTLLFFLLALYASSSTSVASANEPATLNTLTLEAYLDGYVQVTCEFDVDESSPSTNFTLLGEPQDLLIVDESDLLLDYSRLTDVSVTVDTLGCGRMRATYFTQDLTSKTGKYWNLRVNVPINSTIVLPQGASIISLSDIPDLIESSGDQTTLVMPTGLVEISYVAEHSLVEEPTEGISNWLLLAVVATPFILIAAGAVLFFRFRKTQKPTKEVETSRVDIEKLLEREKDLRQEEVQVIQLLAEKNGSAFEAEIYERLALPRTTTWRLLKRLEKMEILEIRKTRRQNIVSVRKKYMKKPVNEPF